MHCSCAEDLELLVSITSSIRELGAVCCDSNLSGTPVLCYLPLLSTPHVIFCLVLLVLLVALHSTCRKYTKSLLYVGCCCTYSLQYTVHTRASDFSNSSIRGLFSTRANGCLQLSCCMVMNTRFAVDHMILCSHLVLCRWSTP